MKPFNLTNFDKLNLELVVAGVTYSDEDFEIDSLIAEAQKSTTGAVVLKGKAQDFERLRNTSEVQLRAVTSSETIVLYDLFVKAPVTFNGYEVSFELDTVPRTAYVSRSTSEGVALPYSFGKPFVQMPRLARGTTGVITENQFALSKQNVLGLIDMYTEVQGTIAALARGGITRGHLVATDPPTFAIGPRESLFKDRTLTLTPLTRFYAEIGRLKELAPHHSDLLEEMAKLPAWKGVGTATHMKVFEYLSPPEVYTGFDNLGMPPPISSHSLLESSYDSLAVAASEWSSFYGGGDVATWTALLGGMLVYSNAELGMTSVSLAGVNAYYLKLCNKLLAAPTAVSVDLGDSPIASVTIDVGGLLVKGEYAEGSITVSSRAPERVSWAFTPTSGKTSQVSVSADIANRDLVGSYVLVDSSIQYFRTQLEAIAYYSNGVPYNSDGDLAEHVPTAIPEHRGALRVVAQDGNKLTLAGLPVQGVNARSVTDTDSEALPELDRFWDFPTSHLELKQVRSGRILAVSSTLAGALYSGTSQLVRGHYNWASTNELKAWDGSSDWQTYDRDDPTADNPDMYIMPTYFAGGGKSWERNFVKWYLSIVPNGTWQATVGYKYQPGSTTASFLNSLRSAGKGSPETDSQKIIAHAFSYEEAEYVWELTAGDTVALEGTEEDVYIVDARANVTVLQVKAKVKSAYLEVPTSMYTVIPSYALDGDAVTAIKTSGDLSLQGFSTDLIVRVDTVQPTLASMLSPLAGMLGKTFTEGVHFPDSDIPAYAVYGATDVLDIASALTEQSRGAILLGAGELKAVYLNQAPVGAPHLFDISKVEAFEFGTTDVLDLVHNTTFKWENFREVSNEATIVLDNPPESRGERSEKTIDVYQDSVNSLKFARWYVHSEGRDWLRVHIDGFVTELHLEPLDYVSVDLGLGLMEGRILLTKFVPEGASVSFDIILNTGGQTLWDIGLDV